MENQMSLIEISLEIMEKLEVLFACDLMGAIKIMNDRREFWWSLNIDTRMTLEEVTIYGATWKISIWGYRK